MSGRVSAGGKTKKGKNKNDSNTRAVMTVAAGGGRQKNQPVSRAKDNHELAKGDNKKNTDPKKTVEDQTNDAEENDENETRKREEEAQRAAEEEKKMAVALAAEARERIETKLSLRSTNLNAQNNRPDEDTFVRLDSSLKKNTAFIRKLKSLTEAQRDMMIKDIKSLNLTKYLGEVVQAIVETKIKMSDVHCSITICSLIHQRYVDFSTQLLATFQKSFSSKKDDIMSNMTKLRVDTRLIAELTETGVFTDKEGLPLLNNILQTLIQTDKESHDNLSIISSFCRHCGEDYAGIVSRKNRLLVEKYELTLPKSEIFSEDTQASCHRMMLDYYMTLSKHLVHEHHRLQDIERQNKKTLQTKGELNIGRKDHWERVQAAYQKMLINISTFADLIDQDMPDLPEDESAKDEFNALMGFDTSNRFLNAEFDIETSLWEDEETRLFYENRIDLKALIPGILIKESSKAVCKSDRQDEEDLAMLIEETAESIEQEMMDLEESGEQSRDEEDSDDVSIDDIESLGGGGSESDDIPDYINVNSTLPGANIKIQMENYLLHLPQSINREFTDQAAVDFCMSLNTAGNRKKLVKALFLVPRQRLDLLPFYSRLVATLYPCMPDVSTELCLMLKGDFKYHVRKKDQINLESKCKTVRFIGELTKFDMFPKTDTLHCLKVLLLDFTHHNIEMACNLLETCGRFLLRSPDSHLRMKVMLDIMMRKKAAVHMDSRYTTMIENAYYYCKPPETKPEVYKKRPPIHQYVRKLLYTDLRKHSVEKVLRQLRKLDWADGDTRSYAIKCLTRIWNVKYNNIACIANLLSGLVYYHEDVGIQVVDGILEDVRIGMEMNQAKFNQRRVSTVKFLGELYNYRMVESSVIFKILYSLIMFAVTQDGSNPLDTPENLFRIRLVCVILDTCGQYFDRGSSKKKLDCFLVFFQRYIWMKKQHPTWSERGTFPLDVEYMICDTIETLRPKMVVAASAEVAFEAAHQLEVEYREKISPVLLQDVNQLGSPGPANHELTTIAEGDESADPSDSDTGANQNVDKSLYSIAEDDEDAWSERGEMEVSSESQSQPGNMSTGHRSDHVDDGALDSVGENEYDDVCHMVTKEPELVKCAEDDEFVSAFERLLTDSVQSRNSETVKVPNLDVAVPMHLRGVGHKKPVFQGTSSDDDTHMKVTLITKKGNKPTFKDLKVPIDSGLVANIKQRGEVERAEKAAMKQLTLNINERQEEEEHQLAMMSVIQKATPPHSYHRDRRQRYQHPKGAPNADLIFSSGGRRK